MRKVDNQSKGAQTLQNFYLQSQHKFWAEQISWWGFPWQRAHHSHGWILPTPCCCLEQTILWPPQSWQLCRNTSVLPIFAKNQYWRHESKHPLPLQSALPQSAVFAISVSCLCSNSIIYPEKHLRCLSGQSCAHIAGHCFQSWVKLCAAEVTAFSGHEFFTLAPPGFPHSYITWEQQKRFIAQIKFSHGSLAD